MTQAVWVDPDAPLPDPRQAGPEGLVAVGMDLSVARLQEAYHQGMFPWFNQGDPVLWWSPDPRMVLRCDAFKISRSLGKTLRSIARQEHQPDARIRVTTNLAFEDVMAGCAAPRAGREGTWILDVMQQVYTAWHAQGGVHSVEIWIEGQLAGGLYGVRLGRFFFGESMFARQSNASKIALAYLVRFLSRQGITHIDCQQATPHLASLGAQTLPREHFLDLLAHTTPQPDIPWGRGQLLADGQLVTHTG